MNQQQGRAILVISVREKNSVAVVAKALAVLFPIFKRGEECASGHVCAAFSQGIYSGLGVILT